MSKPCPICGCNNCRCDLTNCPSCGCLCKVGGRTTHYYIPQPQVSVERIEKIIRSHFKEFEIYLPYGYDNRLASAIVKEINQPQD